MLVVTGIKMVVRDCLNSMELPVLSENSIGAKSHRK